MTGSKPAALPLGYLPLAASAGFEPAELFTLGGLANHYHKPLGQLTMVYILGSLLGRMPAHRL